jgi:hypothetical protein
MEQFRYRTVVLAGPWRASREEAAADAVRAGQASLPEEGFDLDWRVPGAIERSVREAVRVDMDGFAGDPAGEAAG